MNMLKMLKFGYNYAPCTNLIEYSDNYADSSWKFISVLKEMNHQQMMMEILIMLL